MFPKAVICLCSAKGSKVPNADLCASLLEGRCQLIAVIYENLAISGNDPLQTFTNFTQRAVLSNVGWQETPNSSHSLQAVGTGKSVAIAVVDQ